jgi:hypothetical protein
MEFVGLAVKGEMFWILEEVVGLVFLLNRMEDLEALMDYPNQKQYLSRQSLMLLALVMKALPSR